MYAYLLVCLLYTTGLQVYYHLKMKDNVYESCASLTLLMIRFIIQISTTKYLLVLVIFKTCLYLPLPGNDRSDHSWQVVFVLGLFYIKLEQNGNRLAGL